MTSFRDSSSSSPAGCREIPQAPGPEKGVLALLAMDPATYMSQAVAFGVTEDFFHIPAHQLLWRLFLVRYNANLPLDIISVTQALADGNQLDAVGGNAGLAEIYTFTTTGAYFEHYLRTLRDKSLLRSIIDASAKSMT
jgi:replicative DNA helicase